MDVFKLILWGVSLLVGQWYLYGHVVPKYGMRPSISHSAENVKNSGKPWLFSIFILSLTIPLAVIGRDLDAVLAAVLLTPIAFFTGYNEKVENDVLENKLHIIFTMTAIGVGLEWILRLSLWNAPVVVGFIFFTIILVKNKVKNHTWLIEEYVRYMIYLYMLIYKVL